MADNNKGRTRTRKPLVDDPTDDNAEYGTHVEDAEQPPQTDNPQTDDTPVVTGKGGCYVMENGKRVRKT